MSSVGRIRAAKPTLLVLQGPVGGFFGHLATAAQMAGYHVLNVHFNLADRLFKNGGIDLICREPPDKWEEWIEHLCRECRPDAVLMFGDRRPVHIAACNVADRLDIPVYSFEEGYLRPDFVTFERHGNNARSPLPRANSAYAVEQTARSNVRKVAPSFLPMSLAAISYFVALAAGRPIFPKYRHHRVRPLVGEAACWLRNGVRKLTSIRRDRRIERALTHDLPKQYFMVALQVHDDLQLLHHGASWTQERLIEQSIRSFAAHAPSDTALVIRCHPYDRGHRSYEGLVTRVAADAGIWNRVYLMQTGHGPTLLAKAAGLVTINSTMALSALFHGCPVYALGDTFYRVDGLIADRRDEGGLASFWTRPVAVDKDLFSRFTSAVREQSLINGSFYDKTHWTAMTSDVFARLAADGIAISDPQPNPARRPQFRIRPIRVSSRRAA